MATDDATAPLGQIVAIIEEQAKIEHKWRTISENVNYRPEGNGSQMLDFRLRNDQSVYSERNCKPL